jgi:hypothetical protein
MGVGDLVWVVDAQTIRSHNTSVPPYTVNPGLITMMPSDPPEPACWEGRCWVLVNAQDRECLIVNVFTSKSEAEKRAKELHDYAYNRKGVSFVDAGHVYAPYVPLQITPKLAV